MPTCTEAGTYREVCNYCGEVIEDNLVMAAPGHVDENGDKVCDNCGESMGTTPSTPSTTSNKCEKCGKDHEGKTGGFFGYNGFLCRLIALARRITKLFKK